MNENDRYIPPAQGGPGLSGDEQPPQLGKISLLTVVLSLLLGGLARQFSQEQAPSVVLDMCIAIGVLVAFIMAVVALVTRRGRPGVLAPSLSTLVIGGLLIWLGVTNFLRARERALQARERGNSRLSETQLKKIDGAISPSREGGTPPPPPVDQRLAIQKEIQAAVKPCLDELLASSAECFAANRALREAGEFSPAMLNTKELIEKRRAMLVRIVTATEKWDNLQVTAEGKLNEALHRPSIPPAEAKRFMDAWSKERQETQPILTRLHAAERNSSRALIALLSILEHDLGQWELSPDKQKAVFKRPEAAMEYRALSAEAGAAAREQDQMLKLVAARLPKKAPTPPGLTATANPAPAALPAGTPTGPSQDRRNQWVADMTKATGAEGEILRLAKPYLEALYDRNEACHAASNTLHQAGALNLRQLSTAAAIAERRSLVQRVVSTAEQWEELAMNTDQALPAAVNRSGLPAEKTRAFLERWKDGRSHPLPLMKRLRASDRMAGRTMLGILALLERELGQWEPSPDGKQVIFKRPGSGDELRKLMKEFSTQDSARAEALRQFQAFQMPK